MSSGGGGGSQTTQVTYSPEEQAARDKVMNAALGVYDKSAADFNPQSYTGAKPVGFDSATVSGQNELLNYSDKLKGNIGQAQTANNFGLKDALYAESNPYLQSAMTAATQPLIQQFMDPGGALAQTRQGAIQSNGYGGSRQGIAEGVAQGRLQQQVGNMRAQMSSDAYGKGLDQMNNSIKNQSMLSMLGMLPGQIQGQVGAQREGMAQQQENYDASARDYSQNGQWQPLQNLANIIYGGSNGKTTTTGQQAGGDSTMQAVGTLGQLGMMAMMM
jgi:hypothetical protein